MATTTTLNDILTAGSGVAGTGIGRPKTAAPPISAQMPDGTETQPVGVPQAQTAEAAQPGQPVQEPQKEGPYWDWQAGEKTGGDPEPPDGTVPYARGMEPRTVDERPKGLTYTEMWQRLNPYTPPTAEEVEAERRKEKRQKLFAALGDGISALSNLYFTTKGAPSMYTGQQTQSRQVNDRWEKLRQERQANLKEYTEGLMRAQQLDDARWDADRTWKETMENNWRNYQLKKAADERAAETHDLEVQLAQGKITEQEYKTQKAQVDAKYAERVAEAKADAEEAKARKAGTEAQYAGAKAQSEIDRNHASAAASRASAERSRTQADLNRARKQNVVKEGNGKYTAWDASGKAHTFKTSKEAENFARRNNTWQDDFYDQKETTTVTTGKKGHERTKTTKKTTRRRAGGHPVKPQPKPADKPKPAQKKKTGVSWT